MNRIKWLRILTILMVSGAIWPGLLAHPVKSWGYDFCYYYYEALLDVDNNTATGGPATVVQAGEEPHDIMGIDYKVVVFLDVCDPLTLGPIEVWKYNSGEGEFEQQASYETFYDLGVENGDPTIDDHHADVIEFSALKADIGNPGGPMKIVYHASRALVNDYTAAFYYPQQTASPIPTLSQWGMLILAMLLGGSALLVMRKRKTAPVKFICALVIVLSLAGAARALVCGPIILDGLVGDWNCLGIQVAVTDPIDDSSAQDYGEDILKGYITSDNDNLYFRIDIVGGELPEKS